MQIDIKTSVLQPNRQTYDHVARHIGEGKPASRYEEATFNIQAEENYHYRPTWAPQYEQFDRARTAITMENWYAFRDPRQYYYGTYTIARARMIEAEERSFAFVEKRNLMTSVDPEWADRVRVYLIPLRHMEWGANMNNARIADEGYGAAITQAALFTAMDRLGIAQLISRVGLLLDNNEATALDAAKAMWMDGADWQEMRRAIEDSLVIEDWFELFIAQNVALDGIVLPMVFEQLDGVGVGHGGTAVSICLEFAAAWMAEHAKWVDSVVKIAAAESEENRTLLSGWAGQWVPRAVAAFHPIAVSAIGADAADQALKTVQADLVKRLSKAGLSVE